MRHNRFLSSASNAFHHIGQPLACSSSSTPSVAGPSDFPGCLSHDLQKQQWSSPVFPPPFPFSQNNSIRHRHRSNLVPSTCQEPLGFLYPPSCFLLRIPMSSNHGAGIASQNTLPPSCRSYTVAVDPSDTPLEPLAQPSSSPCSSDPLDTDTASSSASLQSMQDQAESLHHYLSVSNPDANVLSSRCSHLALLANKLSKPQDSIDMIAFGIARDAYLRSIESLVDGKLFVQAAILFEEMLVLLDCDGKIDWQHQEKRKFKQMDTDQNRTTLLEPFPSCVSLAQRLLEELCSRQEEGATTPRRGFASQEAIVIVRSLFKQMHKSRFPRTSTTQTIVIRSFLISGNVLDAVTVFDAEVQNWWQVRKQSKSSSSSDTSIIEVGKPSSQILRDIKLSLQRFQQVLLKFTDTMERQLSLNDVKNLNRLRDEYAKSLVLLSRLLETKMIPLDPKVSCNAPEIAWIISACCRFEKTIGLQPRWDLWSKQLETCNQVALEIRKNMQLFIRDLPIGRRRGNNSSSNDNSNLDSYHPPLKLPSYNQLIHYSLAVLKSPKVLKHVFEHMTKHRNPPLEPDDITLNMILRLATTHHFESLSKAVLHLSDRRPQSTTEQPQQQGGVDEPTRNQTITSSSSSPSNRITTNGTTIQKPSPPPPPPPPPHTMANRIDEAISKFDSHRLVALIQYVTSTGLFLSRYRNQADHISVLDLVMRIYPSLDMLKKKSTGRRKTKIPSSPCSNNDTVLERIQNIFNERKTIYQPHVLTASLNLAAKAGKTGLVLRIWRLLLRISVASLSKRSNVSSKQDSGWKIPLQAATILMQVLAREGKKFGPPSPNNNRNNMERPILFKKTKTSRKRFATGWNHHLGSTRRRGGGWNRNQLAKKIAQNEYIRLMQIWGLHGQLLHSQSSSQQQQKEMERWNLVKPCNPNLPFTVLPDPLFFQPLLDLFHNPFLTSTTTTTQQLDPFLIRLLLDMKTLQVPIPKRFHSVLDFETSSTDGSSSARRKVKIWKLLRRHRRRIVK